MARNDRYRPADLRRKYGNTDPFETRAKRTADERAAWNDLERQHVANVRQTNQTNQPCRLHGVPWRQCTLCAPARTQR